MHALTRRSLWIVNGEFTHSVMNVGVELLGQLKMPSWQIYPTLNWALLTCELGKRQKVALNVWNLLKASTKPWTIQNNVIQFAICCHWIYCRKTFHERRSWFYKWIIKKIIEQRKEKRTVGARYENDMNRCIWIWIYETTSRSDDGSSAEMKKAKIYSADKFFNRKKHS